MDRSRPELLAPHCGEITLRGDTDFTLLLPAQIVRSGRRIIYRIMGYNSWLKDFFAAWENLRRMAPA